MLMRSFFDGRAVMHHGDSRLVLKGIADASIDSVVCDPPYALVSIVKRFGGAGASPAKAASGAAGAYARASAGFMSQSWDTGETAFAVEFWAEILRVLKPGGHVVAFGGTRTYHRLAVAIEDAGFEIRDQLGWLYGTGFPKSHDVAKGIDKAAGTKGRVFAKGTRSASRPVVEGQSCEKAYRLGARDEKYVPATAEAKQWEGWKTALKPAWEPIVLARKPLVGSVAKNVLAHGAGALNIGACRVEDEIGVAQFAPGHGGVNPRVYKAGLAGGRPTGETLDTRFPANVMHDGSPEVAAALGLYSPDAIRFFYCAKATKADRASSKHPTIKPVELMRWLVRLVTPPGGIVLEPFAGSGSTLQAAIEEGVRVVGIEREAPFFADCCRRLDGLDGLPKPVRSARPKPRKPAPVVVTSVTLVPPDTAPAANARRTRLVPADIQPSFLELPQ